MFKDLPASPNHNGSHHQIASESSSFGSSSDLDHLTIEDHSGERIFTGGYADRSIRSSQQMRFNAKHVKPITLLRKVHGNDICADCGSPDPDWASLNLGLLVCIECSGVHRNLGVHISKVIIVFFLKGNHCYFHYFLFLLKVLILVCFLESDIISSFL